jgi:hypothetical protein
MRNSSKVEFFLNYIPSYVASRMTPYLDVKFQFQRLQKPDNDKYNVAFGILKFLESSTLKLNDNSANKALYNGNYYSNQSVGGEDDGPYHDTFYRTGMEVFLSPQTMVNPNPEGFKERYVDVIDRFRPLVSLSGLDIRIQPLRGFQCFKDGTLTLKLHDRSRLHEISDLIRTQLYHGTTIWITYGWRHPQEPNNPYANFINENLLVREAYSVVKPEFSFDNVGQVEIKLGIATSGVRKFMLSSMVGDDDSTETLLRQLEDIRKRAKQAKINLNSSSPEGISKEVRAYELLDYAVRGAKPDLKNYEIKKSLQKLKKILDSSDFNKEFEDEAKKVSEDLKYLYGSKSRRDKNQGKFFELLQDSYEEGIRKKFAQALSGPDPWLPGGEEKIENLPEWAKISYSNVANLYSQADSAEKALPNKNNSTNFTKNVVSFGKLFSVFVGDAAASQKEVDEVQIWFYKLNNHCGPISGFNIAEFPIEVSTFLKKYNDYVYNRRKKKVTIQEFITLLIGTQFRDIRAIGYGLREFYEPFDPKKTEPKLAKGKKQEKLEGAIKQRQKKYGVFKKPAIEISIETVHERSDSTKQNVDLLNLFEYIDTQTSKYSSDANTTKGSYKRIMRIHIYDKVVNPYPLQTKLLSDETGKIFEVPNTKLGKKFWDQLMNVYRTFGFNSNSTSRKTAELIKEYEGKEGSNKLFLEENNIQPSNGTVNARTSLREEITKRVPTIVYGTNGTMIENASISSHVDSLVATKQMIKPAGTPVTLQPNGSSINGLPVRIVPASMNMQSFGCPLAYPAQNYFVDFGTGTTIDNLYILTHLNHSFSPGKFSTSWQFSYQDGYARYESVPSIALNFIDEFDQDSSIDSNE